MGIRVRRPLGGKGPRRGGEGRRAARSGRESPEQARAGSHTLLRRRRSEDAVLAWPRSAPPAPGRDTPRGAPSTPNFGPRRHDTHRCPWSCSRPLCLHNSSLPSLPHTTTTTVRRMVLLPPLLQRGHAWPRWEPEAGGAAHAAGPGHRGGGRQVCRGVGGGAQAQAAQRPQEEAVAAEGAAQGAWVGCEAWRGRCGGGGHRVWTGVVCGLGLFVGGGGYTAWRLVPRPRGAAMLQRRCWQAGRVCPRHVGHSSVARLPWAGAGVAAL